MSPRTPDSIFAFSCQFRFFCADSLVQAQALRVGVPIYVAALIASALLLFLPDPVAKEIGIAGFRQLWRAYIGITFIVSIALLASSGISIIHQSLGNTLDNRRLQRITLGTLEMLTNDEKMFLRPFIHNGENTRYANIQSGVAGGLEAKHIIYRSSNVGSFEGYPYNLQPIARKILSRKKHLLE